MSTGADFSHRIRWHLELIWSYARINLQAALEYRASFMSQVVGMFLNDGIWLTFWWLYFTKFPVLGSWQREDVIILWAVLTTSFGIATGFFGNSPGLAGIILRGDLDFYLVLPKDVLLHAIVSRMSTSAWGDVLFGTVIFVVFRVATPGRLALYIRSFRPDFFIALALATLLLATAARVIFQWGLRRYECAYHPHSNQCFSYHPLLFISRREQRDPRRADLEANQLQGRSHKRNWINSLTESPEKREHLQMQSGCLFSGEVAHLGLTSGRSSSGNSDTP